MVQRPHPDELLSSVWIRTRRRAGVGIGLVTKTITGRKFAPSFLSYVHVRDLAMALNVAPVDLLWRHSVFPYATAFVEHSVFEASLASALSTGHAAIGCAATVQSVTEYVRFLQYCPSCAREDQANWGESYWHREHHLPGVWICTRHWRQLRRTTIPVCQLRPWPDLLPSEVTASQLLRSKIDPFVKEVAQRSCRLLARTEISSVPCDRTWYRDQLLTKGLRSNNHQVSAKSLADWACASLGSRVTHVGLLPQDEDFHWLSLMVRPRCGIPFVPLKHVIFQSLLELADNAGTHRMDFVPPGMPAHPTETDDRRYAVAFQAVIQSHRLRGEKVCVADALTEAGCWHQYRHARTRFPRLCALVTKLRESDTSARQVPVGKIKE
nr:TniQ family protein [Rhodoferax sp. U11-2br]